MTALTFEVIGARAEAYAAQPTLQLRLRITESEVDRVHAIALRCQIMIEPRRRRYGPAEEDRLVDLFGETPRWGDTLRPFLWTITSTTVTSFAASTEIDLPITCTYDFEVAAARYLHSLDGGEVPLVLLFSGTTFARAPAGGDGRFAAGFTAEPVAWDTDVTYRLPARLWREVMDLYFPHSGWMRVRCETLDALRRYRSDRVIPTWDETFESLLAAAGAAGP